MPSTSGIFVQNKDWTLLGTPIVTSSSAYTFTIPSSTVTQGTQYTNNGQTFTCTAGIAPGTSLVMAGTGAATPTTGTLTLVAGSGTGPSTLTYTALSNSVPVPGTGGINNLWMRRVGGNAEFRWEYKHTVAGTNGTGMYMVAPTAAQFPYVIDNTLVTSTNTFTTAGNTNVYPLNSVGYLTGEMNTSNSVLSASCVAFVNWVCFAGTAGSSAAGSPSTVNGAYIGFGGGATASLVGYWSVPIVGWSAYD